MDPSEPSEAGGREERRRSIGNVFKRMKTVLKRGRSSSEGSPATAAAAAGETAPTSTVETAPTGQTPEPTQPTDVPAASQPAAEPDPEPELQPDDSEPAAEPVITEPPTFTGIYVNSIEQQERARLLFARYGLNFDQEDFIAVTPSIAIQRVERPIRMRVHRTCHRCQTTFGVDKTCASCQHRRCKKCPRYPAKKAKDQQRPPQEAKPPKADPDTEKPKKKREPLAFRRPGQERDVVYSPARQRVRRVCHKCDALFMPPTATVCLECRHVRCTKCPRQPSKKDKYPQGYPGDAPGEESDEERLRYPYMSGATPPRMYRKPRVRVRWQCEQCSTTFRDPGAKCRQCSHERCPNCIRTPKKKQKKEPEFDPAVIQSLNDKLAQLGFSKPTES